MKNESLFLASRFLNSVNFKPLQDSTSLKTFSSYNKIMLAINRDNKTV